MSRLGVTKRGSRGQNPNPNSFVVPAKKMSRCIMERLYTILSFFGATQPSSRTANSLCLSYNSVNAVT